MSMAIEDVAGACSAPACNRIENPDSQRGYPWEGQADSERMNYGMKIGHVSAVGCYPRGGSPYGCEEMSGNVWEWSRSIYGSYPYPQGQQERQQRETKQGGKKRALRGGALNYFERYVRCAVRVRSNPVVRDYYFGFRVALSPSTSGI